MMTAVDFSLSCHPSPSVTILMVNICCMNRLHTCTPEPFVLEPEGPRVLRGERTYLVSSAVSLIPDRLRKFLFLSTEGKRIWWPAFASYLVETSL